MREAIFEVDKGTLVSAEDKLCLAFLHRSIELAQELLAHLRVELTRLGGETILAGALAAAHELVDDSLVFVILKHLLDDVVAHWVLDGVT